MPVSYFFDEMPSNALSGRPLSGRGRKVRKRIFEMVKAVGAASHAEVLGGRKKR